MLRPAGCRRRGEDWRLQRAGGGLTSSSSMTSTADRQRPHVYRVQASPSNLRDRIWTAISPKTSPTVPCSIPAIGRLLDVRPPSTDSINHIFCVTEEEDYWATGRNADGTGRRRGMNREGLLCHLPGTGERLFSAGCDLQAAVATQSRLDVRQLRVDEASGPSVIGTPSSAMLCARPFENQYGRPVVCAVANVPGGVAPEGDLEDAGKDSASPMPPVAAPCAPSRRARRSPSRRAKCGRRARHPNWRTSCAASARPDPRPQCA